MHTKHSVLIAALLSLPLLAACSDDGGVRVAAVLPLSGTGAEVGTAVHAGMELAAEELARTQGAAAPTLEVVDSGGDPERAAAELTRLLEGGAVAGIAGASDAEALAAARVADAERRVVLSPSASTPQLSGISRWFFRVRPSGVHDGNRMALHAARELHVERVAVVAPADAPTGSAEAFVASFEAQEGKVVERLTYDPAGDLAATAAKAAAAGAQAVYVDGPPSAVAELIAGLRDAKFRGRILTDSGFALATVLAEAGRRADGVLVSRPIFDPESDDPAVREFVTAFEARHGREPGLFEAYGYDAVMTLAAALEAGSSPQDVWKGLHGLQDHRGASGAIQFDERGDVRGFPRVYEVKQGQLAVVGERPAGAERLAAARRGTEPHRQRIGG